MISPIDVALKSIKQNIPAPLLEVCFTQTTSKYKAPSMDANILNDVIYAFVLSDCNVNGGQVIDIVLEASWVINTPEEPYSLFEIPLTAREGRNIVEAHSVSRKVPSMFFGEIASTEVWPGHMAHLNKSVVGHSSAITNAMEAMLESKSGTAAAYQNPTAQIMGNNLIKLRPSPLIFVPWCVTVRLEYDKQFTNLNGAALRHFANICVLAVKRYLYNNLIFKIDKGYLNFGQELPVAKEILQQWSNLDTEYNEACTNFANATFMDLNRFIGILKGAI